MNAPPDPRRADVPADALSWEERSAAPTASAATGADAATARTFRARLPEDYPFFRGHFPGEPVLAGVVQLHELVLPCVRRVLPGAPPPSRLTGLKFLLRIRPGDELDVTLRCAAGAVDFEIARGGSRCATGRMEFAARADAPR